MDETTDDYSRSVVNTIFCYRNEIKLVSVDFLERVNNTTIGQVLMTTLTHFNIPFNLPRLFLSDSAAYMKKCYHEILSPLMPNLIHAPCCAHILNLIRPYYLLAIFFKAELDNDKKHNTLTIINSCLQNEQELGLIIIYLNFISFYASEFIQCLDFFQKIKKPVIPFAELRLQQLTAYIETYRNSNNFSPSLENLIIQHQFNIHEIYSVFRMAFEVAYNKFTAHIPNHPALKEFENPSDELLREWKIYCGLNNELISEV
ncbi:CGG triplet repeat-binding protein 1 [Rhizophagus clarus]|uniref:CGG triplet repeat-binding protein 1 n=1 Tax=Rhizophagus clarus TaxID=94130 RepID=A0A8H3QK34_9GLOM|nr:CGG triplet repeat-binding protein 1 [Rhizophagus clarus]